MKKYLNFILLKPDLLNRNLEESVKQELINKGITIMYEWNKIIDNNDIDCLYGFLRNKSFFSVLEKSLIQKKIIYYVVLSNYSFDVFDKIIGETDPSHANKDSLRNKFWLSILENSIHSSKKHLIVKEIKHFLKNNDFEQLLELINNFYFENKITLHWWSTSEYCENNLNFYNSILSDYIEWEDSILYIPFAWYDKDWNTEKISNNLEKFLWKKYNVILWKKYNVILWNLDNLDNQILYSKYIYINWWDYKKLFNYIWYLKDKKYLLHWKNIIWVSAWANILSKYSYSNDYNEVFEWIWLLDIKTICHFNWDSKLIEILKNKWENTNIINLKEKEIVSL